MREELDEGPGLGALEWIRASQIALGSLGNGVVVDFGHSPACGNGGCPMWLLLRRSSGYVVAIRGAGWGYSIVNSDGSVPDIVFYWHMAPLRPMLLVIITRRASSFALLRIRTNAMAKTTSGVCAPKSMQPYARWGRLLPLSMNS